MRPGSIGFGLFFLLVCCTSPPAPAPAPRSEPPAPAPAPALSVAAVEVISVQESSHPLPEGAPAALAYFPDAFDRSEPYDLVIFLHGWSGCVEVLMRSGEQTCLEDSEVRQGWGLGEILGAPQRVLLMPQLAFRRRDGDAGRFTDADYTRRWLAEALDQLNLSTPRSTALMPHSAGFEAAIAWAQSGVSIQAIFLMDSLYAKAPEFFEWAIADEERVLVTFYTGGSTGRQSRRLARMADREGLSARIRRVHTNARHAVVPSVEGPAVLREFFENSHHSARVPARD